MQKELAVPLRAGQSGVYDPRDLRLPAWRRAGDLEEHPPPHLRISHDSLPRLRASRLELRLHQDDRLPARLRERERRRQCRPQRDEGDVTRHELGRERQLAKAPHVHALQHGHALVFAQARVELAVPDVERDHARGAALQQDVREPTRRGPDVEAVPPRRIDRERVQSVGELLAPAGDIRRRRRHRQLGRLVDLFAGLLVPRHEAREHERLRLRPALGEPALDEQDVEPLLRHQPTTESTASHATSEATTPSAVVSSSGSLSTAPVETANSTSPSSSAWNGWMARAIDACTCRASVCRSRPSRRRLVTTTVSVVFPGGGRTGRPPESRSSTPAASARRATFSGSRWPSTTVPSRSTIAPIAFTTVKTATFVSPTWRKAPPWPAASRSSQPKSFPAVPERPAPRAPSGKTPGRADLSAARPNSLSG